jgi:hypothetical protein
MHITLALLEQERPAGQRLGQWFCNKYVKQPWPELYYASDERAIPLIAQWLKDHHYDTCLPAKS